MPLRHRSFQLMLLILSLHTVHAHYSELDATYALNFQPSQCLYYVTIFYYLFYYNFITYFYFIIIYNIIMFIIYNIILKYNCNNSLFNQLWKTEAAETGVYSRILRVFQNSLLPDVINICILMLYQCGRALEVRLSATRETN